MFTCFPSALQVKCALLHCLLTNFGNAKFDTTTGTVKAQDKMIKKGGKDKELATAIRVCFNRGLQRVLGWYEGGNLGLAEIPLAAQKYKDTRPWR